uniref:protein-histidine N-methyltransferase n=1 Tax=Eubosmina coregoni TaxID=186181 RepID=A0A4Y7LN14_9CRUS|nr:EOG090X0C09 [Eubosmina coregoni]
MFKFNFSSADDQHRARAEKYQSSDKIESYSPLTSLYKFNLVDVRHVEHILEESDHENFKNLTDALELKSDVVKGVYEGGLKIWECTVDLLTYLSKESFNFTGLDVLDLGCGAGILGLNAIKNGAASVHFQDYNSEVLELVTIPNVLLNIDGNKPEQLDNTNKLKFFAGDWGSLCGKLGVYDVVLTSETIYSPANYNKLINIFNTVLKKTGVIYVAAKQHYFGVGGNTRQFEQLLHKHKWETSVCFCSEEGLKSNLNRLLIFGCKEASKNLHLTMRTVLISM